MKYTGKHLSREKGRPLSIAIRSFIATLCAILVIILGYITASYFAGY